MSHTVTVTRTTTSSTTSAVILNIGYCKTVPGILKIAEIIVGAIILAMLLLFVDIRIDLTYISNPRHHYIFFFLYMVVTFFIGSLLLLVGCLVSISTGSIIAKTSYEFIYHGGAFILYAIATVWLLIEIKDRPYDYYKLYFYSGALGVVNSVLYCISCVLAHRSYRWP